MFHHEPISGLPATAHFEFVFGDFHRFLAKIAHAYAVSKLGVDGFIPFLPYYIRRNNNTSLYKYVGSQMPEGRCDSLHWIELIKINSIVDYKSLTIRPTYLYSVRIPLFSNMDAPIYEVAVGSMLPEEFMGIARSTTSGFLKR